MEKNIIRLIQKKGPLTGAETMEMLDCDGLALWRTCHLSEKLITRRIGTRYLRLDRRIRGFARLSPSILREFLTFTVVGFPGEPDALARKINELSSHIHDVNKSKLDLAFYLVSGIARGVESELGDNHQICFIIAGDIVYDMAHDVPRPERSTGKLVNGSDMDLVIVVDDRFPDYLIKRLDDAIYKEKYRLLITPHLKEEIDYIVKRFGRVREQVRFDTFKHMVACKILQEGTLLYGNEDLFGTIKALLREHGVSQRLAELERKARDFRRNAESQLLRGDIDEIKEENLYLFYPAEESEEFE